MQPLRIGLSSTSIEPALGVEIDGIGVYTQMFMQALRSHHTVVPVAFPRHRNWQTPSLLENGQFFKLPYTFNFATSLLRSNSVGVAPMEAELDLFHVTDYIVPKFKNIPVVSTLHDAMLFRNPEWLNRRLRSFKNWAIKKSASWADHFTTISKTMVPDLVEYWGISESKISVVYPGVSPYWFEPVNEMEKQQLLQKLDLRPNFLLFVGTMQPKKNLERLIAAFKSLPPRIQREHPLVLVGKCGWGVENLLQSIKALQNEGVLRWLDYLPVSQLRCLYQSASMFLFPSLYEGFGLPILEAFATKLPVITSNISAMPEVAGNAAHIVNPHSTDEIRAAILTLLDSESLRQSYIARGQQRVQDFSWNKCVEKTIEIYQKLV